MAITEDIQQHIRQLPESAQSEVLDFVQYLVAKTKLREESDWSALSLTLAMQGMENDDPARYTTADLKVVFA